jgi:hypothetical protein
VKTLILLLLAATAGAQESASVLKLGVGGRALGLGGAYTAIADDVSAVSWNPAGLSNLSKRELGAMHGELPAGARYDFFGFAQPLRYGTLGFGALHLAQGSVTGRDDAGRLTGDYSASDTALSLSYGARIRGVGLGVTAKHVRTSVADRSQSAVGFDAGASYGLGQTRLGFAAQNLGNATLPMSLTGGAAYVLPVGLTVAADLRYRPRLGESEFAFGTEYAILPQLSLRGGYGTSKMGGINTGFGLKVHGYSLDYSITPFGELGTAQRISLGARF